MALRTVTMSRPRKRASAWFASGIVRNHVLARFLATFNSNISMREEHSEVWIYGTAQCETGWRNNVVRSWVLASPGGSEK